MKFYIIVPVYKAEKYLVKCIESVLCQTYTNYMLVLVDDGSPDKSGSICDAYAEKFDFIHVIHQENKGQIAARGVGERYCLEHHDQSGAFVVYLDSDDTLEANALEKINEVILKHHPDMVVYNWRLVLENGDIISEQNNDGNSEVIEEKCDLYKKLLLDQSYNSLCRKAVNIKIVKREDHTQHYHIRLGEDLIRSLDYLKQCRRVVILDTVLYNYLMNPTSVTHSATPDDYLVDTTVLKYVYEFLVKEDVFSPKDYEDYWKLVQEILVTVIKKIAYMKISRRKKIVLYQQIKVDDIWNKSLDYQGNIKIINLFKKEKYKTILFGYKIRRVFAKIKHTLIK